MHLDIDVCHVSLSASALSVANKACYLPVLTTLPVESLLTDAAPMRAVVSGAHAAVQAFHGARPVEAARAAEAVSTGAAISAQADATVGAIRKTRCCAVHARINL